MTVDLRCADCGYVGRFTHTRLTIHHNPVDGFALVVGVCPLCGQHVAVRDGAVVDRLTSVGTPTRRLAAVDSDESGDRADRCACWPTRRVRTP